MSTIKRITIDQLRPGMYIHDLNCGWLDHGFLLPRFEVRDDATIARIVRNGIKELYIDVDRGLDVPLAETRQAVHAEIDNAVRSFGEIRQERLARSISIDEERRRAAVIYGEAAATVKHLLDDTRFGRQLEVDRLDPLIERMIESVFRHNDALIPLARLKHHDSYTFEHAVASSALMIAFGRNMGYDRELIHQIASGAMLQDVGMATVPTEIVDKSSRMTEAESELIRSHVEQSHLLVGDVGRLSAATLEVISQHHERVDGTGYPYRLAGKEISTYGQMAAIVDVYDAMTSPRPYRQAMTPTAALRKLYEWGRFHFNAELVQAFIRTIGIYPVGALVRLESGRLGVVVEQTENLLQPKVRIFYSIKTGNFFEPEIIQIGRGAGANHGPIVSHEAFESWNLDPARWVPS